MSCISTALCRPQIKGYFDAFSTLERGKKAEVTRKEQVADLVDKFYSLVGASLMKYPPPALIAVVQSMQQAAWLGLLCAVCLAPSWPGRSAGACGTPVPWGAYGACFLLPFPTVSWLRLFLPSPR